MRIKLALVWVILSACMVVFVIAIVLLAGTSLGFVLAFGSGILGYECGLVIRKLTSIRAEEGDVQTRIAV